jgi:hypothetical protein
MTVHAIHSPTTKEIFDENLMGVNFTINSNLSPPFFLNEILAISYRPSRVQANQGHTLFQVDKLD